MAACLVVEDHPLTLDGTTLGIQRIVPAMEVHQAVTLSETLAKLAQTPGIDLVLLDLDLPDSQGVATLSAVTAWCTEQGRDVRVVVLSGRAEVDLVRSVVENYGTGFILKASSREIFEHALRLTLAGGVFIPDIILRKMPGGASSQPGRTEHTPLTPRESEIAALLVRGFTYKRIARELEKVDGKPISEHTVRAHVGNIAWKLGVTENAKAGVMAEIARRGLTFAV